MNGDAHVRGRRRVLWWVIVPLALVVLAINLVLFTPLLDRPVATNSTPTSTYDDAMARAELLLAQDTDEINPACRSKVIDQGRRTDKAVVLLHGFTNCPAQFDIVAQAYADQGYSVVVPRLPGHGYSDRLTDAPSDVHPADIADLGDEAVDIATGLGQQVEVVGLSGGGTLAGWLASRRPEITRATLIAPLVIPKVMPAFTVAPVARLARFAPDYYLWWDSSKKEALNDPPYAYPRYSLRSLGAFLTLGRSTLSGERAEPLDQLVVVTNENDGAVSNVGVGQVADHLADSSLERIDKDFPAADGYGHDLIDPQGENADRIEEIYPQLAELLGLPALQVPSNGGRSP
jgi:carboxylesterase